MRSSTPETALAKSPGTFAALILFMAIGAAFLCEARSQAANQVRFTVYQRETGLLSPCRVHLRDARQNPVFHPSLPQWRDHFVCPGEFSMELDEGEYHYVVERGPEHQSLSGSFDVSGDKPAQVALQLGRVANLRALGWRSADLHVHRDPKDIELLLNAEDLDLAPVITWWNQRNPWNDAELPKDPLVKVKAGRERFYHLMGGEDERQGGALLYFNLNRPLEITEADREYPSPMVYLQKAVDHPNVWVDIEKPFWWDVPVWLASGMADSIGLANNHMERSSMYESEAWGKPRDAWRLPPPLGNGFWSQEIYYHILNAGMRIPPSAGSASGVLKSPVGYNRVYARTGDDDSYEGWWMALRAGRCFVTNGPLLLATANGRHPGHVFRDFEGPLKIDFDFKLISKDPIRSIEVIKNGSALSRIDFPESLASLKLEPIEFQESGWFLIRVIADVSNTFRFASTAPFYVETGGGPIRISRKSTQFFLDWIHERMEKVDIEDPDKRREVLSYHREAERWWKEGLQNANAD